MLLSISLFKMLPMGFFNGRKQSGYRKLNILEAMSRIYHELMLLQ